MLKRFLNIAVFCILLITGWLVWESRNLTFDYDFEHFFPVESDDAAFYFDFRDKFEQRIMKAVEEDDRVEYHDLILDIQTFQIPMAQNQEGDEIDATAPVIKIIQNLNKNEYRG
jgi:hypothetical protein